MKKYVLSGLVALALAMAIPVTGYSQMTYGVQANIPFEFAVSGKVLPGGEYVVRQDRWTFLTIQSRDGSNGVLAQANSAQSKTPRQEATLVFDRVGDHYFLAQIWEPGSDTGVQIPRSKMERELIKRTLARSLGGEHQAGPELVYVTGRLF
jgi:hypothetical protein